MSNTRIPTQKRSIEKRNKIIEKGFELMCENGFHNTTTSHIAQYAGVSTGIIYQYFNDKKEIFLEGIKIYSDKIMYPVIDILKNERVDISNMQKIIERILDALIRNHTMSKRAHEELVAMGHLDKDVAAFFKNSELVATEQVVDFLDKNGIKIDNPKEKIHVIIGIIDNYCHEVVYHKHDSLNYDVMKEYVVSIIVKTLN